MARLRILAALFAVLVGGNALAQAGGNGNGNGANVGKGGFLVNVNAFEQCPAGDFLDSNRHQIAVKANYSGNGTDKTAKTNKIFLKQGDDFWVQDGNACDNGAYFYLPITDANCSNCDGEIVTDPTFTQYEVRARVLGQPGGQVTVTSCVEESSDDAIIADDDTEVAVLCSVGDANIWVADRIVGSGKAQNKWDNVSAQLLTVCVDTVGDGVCDDRIGLFDAVGQDYWWNWDTKGRPHVQLVFVPVQSSN